MKKGMIITNNPKFKDLVKPNLKIEYRDVTAQQILILARNYIHQNYNLLTHPLHSSLKPNETPFRSVVVSQTAGTALNMESVQHIENAISSYDRFLKDVPLEIRDDIILQDFQVIDYDLIIKAME